ncbi:MAG TPA: hypothetical protein VGO57_02160 [Verrucomicrobiae bacterium]|jgi:hypothetical protein
MSNLFGKHTFLGTLDDGRKARITVRQIKVKEYPTATLYYPNEYARTKFCSSVEVETEPGVFKILPLAGFDELSPASYEEAQKEVVRLNEGGFFLSADRQMKLGVASLQNMPPEVVEKMISQMSLPPTPPRATSA